METLEDKSTLLDQESVDFVFEITHRVNTKNVNLDAVSEKNSDQKTEMESQHKKLLEENYLNRSLQSFDYSYYPNQIKNIKKKEQKNANIKKEIQRSTTMECFSAKTNSNGFISNKVRPVFDTEFSYLNRNKLVNRRLTIRKHFQNAPGLQSLNNTCMNEFPTIQKKITTEFKLANPIDIFLTSQDTDLELDNDYARINTVESQNHLDQNSNSNILFTSLNTDYIPVENKNLKKRNWYNNEAKKFYRSNRSDKSASVVIIEKKSYKLEKEDGPNPFSYHIPRRPPNEKSAPVISLGKRTFKEKSGGGRTSWEKEWYNSDNPFTIKTNFNREYVWPAPNNYKLKSQLGSDSINGVYPHAPMHTIGIKFKGMTQDTSAEKQNLEKEFTVSKEDLIEKELTNTNLFKKKSKSANNRKKSGDNLNVVDSFKSIGSKAPEVSLKFRNKGTILWPDVEKTPGPGSYDLNKFKNVVKSAPKYSTPHARLELNSTFPIGPYAVV